MGRYRGTGKTPGPRPPDRMNVLMVASSYPKFPGDVTAPFIESIAHAVAARGHAVDVLLPHHPDLRRPPGEPVRVLQYGYAPREEWSLWGYAQSLESDVRVRSGMRSEEHTSELQSR